MLLAQLKFDSIPRSSWSKYSRVGGHFGDGGLAAGRYELGNGGLMGFHLVKRLNGPYGSAQVRQKTP